ncbi:malate:quinone oxidoreductase [Dyadobacter sp. CY347]
MVTAADGSLAALLGASPGASTAVSIMLELIQKCFKEAKSEEWQAEFKKIIPSFGESLSKNAELAAKTRARTTEILELGASHYSEEFTA